MSNKNETFTSKIKSGKISPPTRFEFNIEKWTNAWEKMKEHASIRDKKIYQSGIVIGSLLSEIRRELAVLYSKPPKTTYEKLIISYIALANRDRFIATNISKENSSKSPFRINVDSNYMRNKITLPEIVHGCVDGLEKAIRMCQKNIENKVSIKKSEECIDFMIFINMESHLSQLYELYSHIWQCIFWSDYDFYITDEKENIYCVCQPYTEFELSFENSAIRRERLSAQEISTIANPKIFNIFNNDKYVTERKSTNENPVEVINIESSNELIKILNANWQVSTINISNHFPEEWLTKQNKHGFSIKEALSVMRCLMLMSIDLVDKFPEDDSAFSFNKLQQFCPRINAFWLQLALSKATSMNASKISKILDFMTFSSNQSVDLWCHPLVKLSKNEYAILTSALVSPVITRVVEKWCVELGINLDQKGYKYEKVVIEKVNEALVKNTCIKDYDKAVSKRIKAASAEEEFDLLIRIEDLIIIGEFKSIVTIDSEISKQRAAERLEYAGEQVNRKTVFFNENIEAAFAALGWKFDAKINYRIEKCILNSARMFIGYKFSDVPVIDETILKSYFESNTMRLLSTHDKEGNIIDIAWYELYSNSDELKSNLNIYLNNPPQLSETAESFEYGNVFLPTIPNSNIKFFQRRLVLSNADIDYRMKQKHHFKVIKSQDYNEVIKRMDIVI